MFNYRVLWIFAISVLSILSGNAKACELARGYFYQVTSLKGRIVGRSLGPVQFRWLRRMFSVSGAELTLYDYNQPFNWDHKPPAIARTQTTPAGEFEFGDIKEGHYRLEIHGESRHSLFDVEITNQVSKTKSILIDVSPIHPDCTGGHQFEVEAEKK